tara:strand:+ start:4323 stop:5030 length:708 start_codon:yes stop_codon:yes gene_type:complete
MTEHFNDDLIDGINVNPEINYFSSILNYVLGKFKPYNICDVGCRNGKFTGLIKSKHNCNIIGIDGSEYALSRAKKLNFDDLLLVDDFSKDNLKIRDNSFDLIICKDVFEHLINPNHLVGEIHRILKPNGLLLSHVPNHFPFWGRLKFLIENNLDTFRYFPSSGRDDFPYIRFFTLKSMIKMFAKNNLSVYENLSFHFFKLPLIDRFFPLEVKKFLCRIFTDNFSEGITLILKKTN